MKDGYKLKLNECYYTCKRSKDGSILDRSPWLIMKKSATFQDCIFAADLVSTQFLQANNVA